MHIADVTAEEPRMLPFFTAEVADFLAAFDDDYALSSPFVVVSLVIARHSGDLNVGLALVRKCSVGS